MQGVENNKVNKWILWVNNLKQIEKNPQTVSLHQSGAGINHLPKLFADFLKWNLKINFSSNFAAYLHAETAATAPVLVLISDPQTELQVMLTVAFPLYPYQGKLRAGEGRRRAEGVTQTP